MPYSYWTLTIHTAVSSKDVISVTELISGMSERLIAVVLSPKVENNF